MRTGSGRYSAGVAGSRPLTPNAASGARPLTPKAASAARSFQRWGARGVALAVVLLVSAPAFAARVLEVRVGRHPTFTRVVFELDKPVGYRIERAEGRSGASELIVSLDAASKPHRLKSARSLIDQVSVDPAGPKSSVARIRLSQKGLKLKEMILSGPPRIVLDVLAAPGTTTAAATKPKAKAKPKPTQQAKAPEPKPAATARPKPSKPRTAVGDPGLPASPSPHLGGKPTPRPAPTTKLEVPSPRPAPTPAASPEETAAAVPVESDTGVAELEASAGGEEAELRAEIARALESDESTDLAMATPEPGSRAAPTPAATPQRRTPPESSGLFSPRNLGLAAGGAVLLAVLLVWLRRRSSGAGETTVDAESELDENPFAALEMAPGAEQTADAESSDAVDATPDPFADFTASDPESKPAEEEPMLFEEPAAEGAAMDTANTGIEVPASAAAGVGGGEDILRIVRELERRVASLETRLDEAVDAKERLERQVAAQTEELRVQRAAIARTQRAVRNLSRPDDENATEPAPRQG